MGGRFVPGATDDLLPGSYTNFESATALTINAPLDGTVALPFTHDWGPNEVVTDVNSLGQWKAIFGSSTDTPGYKAVKQIFQGEGIEGRGGAAQIKAYRMTGTGAAKALKNLADTTGSPIANAVIIRARYEGTRGNDFALAVVPNAANSSTKNDLVVYDGSIEIERYPHIKADLAGLAAAVNAGSNFITADASNAGATALAATGSPTPVSLTGGNDGNSAGNITGTDWSNATAALGQKRFSVFVADELSDSTILAAVKVWADNLNAKGKRFTVVVGGLVGESLATAITRSATFNNENYVNFGVGSYRDLDLIDPATGLPYTLSSAQVAPRIAGIIAAAGESQAITFARLKNLEIISGPTDDEILSGLANGVLTVGQDSNAEAPVRVVRGITTYTSDTSSKRKKIYGTLKFVRTMQGFENEVQNLWETGIIGKMPVDQETREFVVGKATEFLKERVSNRVIQDTLLNGDKAWSVKIATDPAPGDDDDFVAVDYEMAFERALEKVLNRAVVS